MTETVMLPPHHLRSASLRAESFNEADNTIEVVFSTGATVMRYDWDGPYTETLVMSRGAVRLDRLNAGAPFLNSHSSYDLDDIIGCVVAGTARIEGKTGVCSIKLSTNPDRAGVISDIRAGVIRNVSVGYIVHQMTRTEATDDKMASCLVTDWEPIEISAVPIPADASAQIRSDQAPATNPCIVERAVDPLVEARTTETARVQGIIKVARQLGLADTLADTAITSGSTLDAFRAVAIEAQTLTLPAETTRQATAPAATPASPSAAIAASQGEPAMSERNQDTVTMTEPSPAVTAPAPAAPAVDAAEVRKSETARVQGIMLTARKLNLPTEVSDRAIADNVSLDAFRGQAIDAASEAQRPTGQTTAHAGASDASHRVYAEPQVKTEKGAHAARLLVALASSKGSRRDAADFVTQKYGRDGEVVARALVTGIGSAGGFLVPPEMSAEVIELLRPQSAVMASGPNILPMPNGNLMIPRVQSGSSAAYVGESAPIGASQPGFGMVQLSAKKLAALVPISNDMIRYATAATDAIVRDDMVRSIATRTDLAFIRGLGGIFSPRGLKSWATESSLLGANTLTANYLVGSAYAAVNQAQAIAALTSVTTDLGNMELALMNANIPMNRPGWIFSPRTMMYLMNLRDGLGNQIFYQEMSNGKLRGKPFRTTTQIPNNLAGVNTDGATANTTASEVYLADFSEVFVGESYGLEIDVFPGGAYIDANGVQQNGISNDQTVMRAIVQHDMAMRQEAAVAVLTQVCWF